MWGYKHEVTAKRRPFHGPLRVGPTFSSVRILFLLYGLTTTEKKRAKELMSGHTLKK